MGGAASAGVVHAVQNATHDELADLMKKLPKEHLEKVSKALKDGAKDPGDEAKQDLEALKDGAKDLGDEAKKALAGGAKEEPDRMQKLADENDWNKQFGKNYDPELDDKGGNPLSSLAVGGCPIFACMYNMGLFTSLNELVKAAKAEKFTGWDSSPAHKALYDGQVPAEELKEMLLKINFAEVVAALVTKAVTRPYNGKFVKLFQCYTRTYVHGESTRIRYSWEPKCIGGFRQERFDEIWKGLDKNDDDKMELSEMRDMMSDLTDPIGKPDVVPAWFKKVPVFSLVYNAFNGVETNGISKELLENLFNGTWKGAFPKLISGSKLLWECLGTYMSMGQKDVEKEFLELRDKVDNYL